MEVVLVMIQTKVRSRGGSNTFLDNAGDELVASSVERFWAELAKASEEADNWSK